MAERKKKIINQKMHSNSKVRKITKLEKSRGKAKKIIAIDLGGTNLRIAIVKNRNVLKYWKEKTPKTSLEILKIICLMILKELQLPLRDL